MFEVTFNLKKLLLEKVFFFYIYGGVVDFISL